MTTDARDKLIEAMARAIYADEPISEDGVEWSWDRLLKEDTGLEGLIRNTACKVLTAIAEQGYAVVPRGEEGSHSVYARTVAAADILVKLPKSPPNF